MLNTSSLFSLLYGCELSTIINSIEKLYPKNGYYVFRRKKHNQGQYYSYLKANNNNNASITSLTCPAFPTFLLPPDNIIEQLEKSPKLSLDEGFRNLNWNEIIGEFYCCIDDIEFNSKKIRYSTYIDKLLYHLNSNNSKINDEYIYSIYLIEKLDNLKYYCGFLEDITQKNDKTYSKKMNTYTQLIEPYTVDYNMNNTIMSNYGKN